MNIFTLTGNIFVDNEKANESISKTDEKAKGLAGKLSEGISTAAKWGAGLVTAAGAAGGAMIGLASNTANAAGEIDDMSQRAGMTAEEFQKYAYAAKLSGMETSTLESAMIKQQKAFADAKTGNDALIGTYQQMGIDINNVGSSSEAFDLVIQRLASMTDESERNALANDIFGKSYAELTPMLNQGAEGINALKNEAVVLGGVMSNEAVAAGADFGDSMDKAKTMVDGLWNSMGTQLIPIINELLNWVIEHMPEIQEKASNAFNTFGNAIKFVKDNSDWLIPVLSGLLGSIVALQVISTINGLMDAWKASTIAQTIASGGLNAVLAANPIGAVITVIGGLIAIGVSLYQNWDTIKIKAGELHTKLNSVFDGVSKKAGKVVDAFYNIVDGIKEAIDWLTFWNNESVEDKTPKTSKSNSKINGSHANGLAYVPFDGYIAETHKGERILTAEENSGGLAAQIINGLVSVLDRPNNNNPIILKLNINGKEFAQATYQDYKNEALRVGVK